MRFSAVMMALGALAGCSPEVALVGAVEDTADAIDTTWSPDDSTQLTEPDDVVADPLSATGSLVAPGLEEVRGLAIRDASGFGLMGLAGGLQAFHVQAGLGAVLDVLPGAERIGASRVTKDGAWCLGVLGDGVAAVVDGGTFEVVVELPTEGLRALAVDEAGGVVLREHESGCQVAWMSIGGEDEAAVVVPDEVCGADELAVLSGVAFAAVGGRLWRMDASGAVSLSSSADRVVSDPVGDRVMAWSDGEQGLVAVDARGGLIWRSEVPGEVVTLAVLASSGHVAALVRGEQDGIALIDGSGGLAGWHPLSVAGDGLVASEDGAVVAHVWSPNVEFYAVDDAD